MKGFSWSEAKNLLDQVMSGVSLKAGLERYQMEAQEEHLLKQLRLNYLDSLTGGLLNQMLSGKVRAGLKRFLKVGHDHC
jgi:hypothetical protein